MGHLSSKGYLNLQNRLDGAPQGAPKSKALKGILSELFTEEEADLVSKLSFTFFTAKQAARKWSFNLEKTKTTLASLAGKAIVFDFEKDGKVYYFLVPTMAGFFEFSLMRIGDKFNKKLLSELYYQYINKENEFAHELFSLYPPFGRTIAQEDMVLKEDGVEVLDYERLSCIIDSATEIVVGTCFCRHKMEHIGKKCHFPQDVCFTLNAPAEVLKRHRVAKKISKKEALKKIHECMDLGLAQFGDNVQNDVSFICNCCPCCCEAASVYKRFYNGSSISASNYIACDRDEKCNACGICKIKCPFDAIKCVHINNKKIYKVDKDKCLGCGVCARLCPQKAKTLKRRDEIAYTPTDVFERILVSALNAGKLQNYIFNNKEFINFKIFNKIVRVILSLPLTKKLFAVRQTRSIFLNMVALGRTGRFFNEFFAKGRKPDYSHKELKENKK